MGSSEEKNSSLINIILFVIVIIAFFYLVRNAIVDNTRASYLKKVCTAVTYSKNYSTEHSKITSLHTVASYEIDGREFTCKGMYRDEPDLWHIEIHYNPDNVSEAYCGKGPVCSGIVEIFSLSACTLALIFGSYEFIKKKK